MTFPPPQVAKTELIDVNGLRWTVSTIDMGYCFQTMIFGDSADNEGAQYEAPDHLTGIQRARGGESALRRH